MIIAIDGPAASGKGTLARKVAAHYGLHYLDTGALYRAVARDGMARGLKLDDARSISEVARALDPDSLVDSGLRDPGIGEAASIVAGLPQVRAALLEYQREFAAKAPGAVLDGRDIGSVVCPEADVKIFVEARPEIRAKRRFLERQADGDDATFEMVLELIRERDARDAGRGASPMIRAEDAHLLETSEMGIDQAFDAAVGVIERTISR